MLDHSVDIARYQHHGIKQQAMIQVRRMQSGQPTDNTLCCHSSTLTSNLIWGCTPEPRLADHGVHFGFVRAGLRAEHGALPVHHLCLQRLQWQKSTCANSANSACAVNHVPSCGYNYRLRPMQLRNRVAKRGPLDHAFDSVAFRSPRICSCRTPRMPHLCPESIEQLRIRVGGRLPGFGLLWRAALLPRFRFAGVPLFPPRGAAAAVRVAAHVSVHIRRLPGAAAAAAAASSKDQSHVICCKLPASASTL